MDSQPQPSLLQVAQNVHKPAAAAPGQATPRGSISAESQSFPIYHCFSPHCTSTFPNPEDLDLHYRLGHTPYVPGFEGVPLANTLLSPGDPLQPLSSFRPNANLVESGSSAIGAFVNDPFMGPANYNDISVNEHHQGLLTHDDFRMHQRSPSLSLADDFPFVNEPLVYTIGGDQPITPALPALLPLVPIEIASTIASPAASFATFSSAPPSQAPITRAPPPPPRHVCVTCSKSFSRAGDVQRHAKKHNPIAPRIDCPFPGCPYTGAKGFLRNDKLTDHWQNRHQ